MNKTQNSQKASCSHILNLHIKVSWRHPRIFAKSSNLNRDFLLNVHHPIQVNIYGPLKPCIHDIQEYNAGERYRLSGLAQTWGVSKSLRACCHLNFLQLKSIFPGFSFFTQIVRLVLWWFVILKMQYSWNKSKTVVLSRVFIFLLCYTPLWYFTFVKMFLQYFLAL